MKKNGIRLLLLTAAVLVFVCAWACGPAEGTDPLTYEVLPDGSGMQVTGCDPSAESVTIPAEHDGLPVVSIKEGAFLRCTQLKEFLAEEGQETFYAQDGVLFTDPDGFKATRDDYYKERGWVDGVPTRATLERLGLGYVADDLEARGLLKG